MGNREARGVCRVGAREPPAGTCSVIVCRLGGGHWQCRGGKVLVLAAGIGIRGGPLGFPVTLLENPRPRASDELGLRQLGGFFRT